MVGPKANEAETNAIVHVIDLKETETKENYVESNG